jgi:ABC-type transporter Mla maintaining outer membrane lipid asymmetry ATPase subunit MlaF
MNWTLLLGHILGTDKKLKVAWDQLQVHTLILGGSGSGKSKLLEWIMRQRGRPEGEVRRRRDVASHARPLRGY